MDIVIDRNKIHSFIDRADERILRIISAIMHSEDNETDLIPDEHQQILDERIKEYRSGIVETKTLEEAGNKIRQKYEF